MSGRNLTIYKKGRLEVSKRTNIKIKIKGIKEHKMVYKRFMNLKYSEALKRFMFLPFENMIKKIKFSDGVKCDITIYYTKDRKITNSGIYEDEKEALYAFHCFMEKETIMEWWDKVLLAKRVVPEGDMRHLKLTQFKKGHNVPPKTKSL